MRKLIAFDDDTFDKLKQLARDRMATIQELADEAFADLLKKHGIPVDLKDALRKSAALKEGATKQDAAEKFAAEIALKRRQPIFFRPFLESRPVGDVEFRGTSHRLDLRGIERTDHPRRRADDQANTRETACPR